MVFHYGIFLWFMSGWTRPRSTRMTDIGVYGLWGYLPIIKPLASESICICHMLGPFPGITLECGMQSNVINPSLSFDLRI